MTLISALLAVLAISSPSAAIAAQPNILLFIADDQDYTYYGFQGHPFAQTPNIDALAAQGVLFESGYATASVCLPSLQSLLFGMPWQVFGRLASEIREAHGPLGIYRESQFVPFTLPRLLRMAGYTSFAGGKMWQGTFEDAGFDAGTMDSPPSLLGIAGQGTFGRESLQELYDFVDAQEGPWFAWVAPMLPHLPTDPSPEHEALYDGLGLGAQAQAYWGNVTRSDARVGDVLDFLDERGLANDTIVIYLADNGWVQPETDLTSFQAAIGANHGKVGTWDRSARTPIIIRWPEEIRAGGVSRKIVDFNDVFATILDYAEAPGHPCARGRSFRQLADDGRGRWRRKSQFYANNRWRPPTEVVEATQNDPEPVPAWINTPSYYLRYKNWGYSRAPDLEIEEIFHLKRDPNYQTDFAARRVSLLRKMRRIMDEKIEEQQGHTCTLADANAFVAEKASGEATSALRAPR